ERQELRQLAACDVLVVFPLDWKILPPPWCCIFFHAPPRSTATSSVRSMAVGVVRICTSPMSMRFTFSGTTTKTFVRTTSSPNPLPAPPLVDCVAASRLLDVLAGGEGERLRRTTRRTQGPLACLRAVVAVIALHHLIDMAVVFWNAEGTRQHAVGAADASRL